MSNRGPKNQNIPVDNVSRKLFEEFEGGSRDEDISPGIAEEFREGQNEQFDENVHSQDEINQSSDYSDGEDME